MATTTQVTITRTWQQLHTDTCVVQAVHSSERFEFAGSAASPTDGAAILARINEPVEINLKGAVWCRLSTGSRNTTEKVIVIK